RPCGHWPPETSKNFAGSGPSCARFSASPPWSRDPSRCSAAKLLRASVPALILNSMTLPHLPPATTRRDFLFRAGGGLGGIALAHLLARDAIAEARQTTRQNPLAAKKPHFEPKAKRIIFMFMVGGPSPLDLFDPKPELAKWAGKPLPKSHGTFVSQFTKGDTPLLPSTRKFSKHGQSGLPVSDLMPNLATCVNDICFLRSCWCNSAVHAPAMY